MLEKNKTKIPYHAKENYIYNVSVLSLKLLRKPLFDVGAIPTRGEGSRT